MPQNTAIKRDNRLSSRVRLGGLVARTLFIVAVIVLTARVASPQIEHLSSVLETPGDFIRVALGFAVCAWCAINLFIVPKDDQAYRTWIYLGIAVLPLSLLCTLAVW